MNNEKFLQTTIIGKTQNMNKTKSYRLNVAMKKYFELIKLYISTGVTSGTALHEMMYDGVKRDFNLDTALVQTARDNSVRRNVNSKI